MKATLHWVSAKHAVMAEVRLYDHLFTKENPDDAPEGGTWRDNLNPDSLKVLPAVPVEPSLAEATAGQRLQLERVGYFCADPDSAPGKPVLNRTVTLKDTWAKIQRRKAGSG